MNKIVRQFTSASALLLATSAVSLFAPTTAHAQSASVTAERRPADNAIILTWENISSDTGRYHIIITESGVDDTILEWSGVRFSQIFSPAGLLGIFARMNNAERIGVAGEKAGVLVDHAYTSVPPRLLPEPIVTVERLADNSLKISWENIRTNELQIYSFFVINDGSETRVNFVPPGTISSFTFSPEHASFNEINSADRVGVAGSVADGSGGTEFLDKTFRDIPPEPTVIVVRLADNSLKISWENIRTGNLYTVHITESGTDKPLFTASSSTSELILDSSHHHFDRLSNAERIGISGSVSGERTDERFVAVPALNQIVTIVTDLSFTYNESGHTLVSFTPSTAGDYTISYTIATDETAVPFVTATAVQANSPVTATLLTGLGYTGTIIISFGDTAYASDTIQVPPAPPTLVAGEITDTSIVLSWDAQRSAQAYLIYQDDISLLVFLRGTTYTHTNLTPGTEYTYTAESTYDGTISTRSDALAVSTTISIANLDGESDVSIKDAKFLYYAHALDLTPEDSATLATVLGPLTSFGDDRLGDLLTAVRSLSVDLNSDEVTDAKDAAVLYYSFALEASLGNGTHTKPGLEGIKSAILGPLAGTNNDMAAINAMLQRVYEKREP